MNCPITVVESIVDRVLDAAADRTVLNVGAAGGWEYYLPDHVQEWMHVRLTRVAASVIGLDVDRRGVEAATAQGFPLVLGDCQSVDLGQQFDMILMSDVIEHLERPGDALSNLARHLAPGGRLYITTPNATFVGHIFDAVLRKPLDVYWDHVCLFAPEHVQSLCDRHSLTLHEVSFFSFLDRRTAANAAKSRVIRLFAGVSPRLHGHFLAVVGQDEASAREAAREATGAVAPERS